MTAVTTRATPALDVASVLDDLFAAGANWVTAGDVASRLDDVSFRTVVETLDDLVADRTLVSKLVPVYESKITAYRSRTAPHICDLCRCDDNDRFDPLAMVSGPIRFLRSHL